MPGSGGSHTATLAAAAAGAAGVVAEQQCILRDGLSAAELGEAQGLQPNRAIMGK